MNYALKIIITINKQQCGIKMSYEQKKIKGVLHNKITFKKR